MTTTETDQAERIREAARTGTLLSLHAQARPDHPALLSATGDRTFGELDGNINRLARYLREHGVQAGDSVALVCSNRPEFAETLYAGTRSGLRVTPVNWHLTAEEMAYIVDDCEAKVVVGDVRFADRLADVADRCTGVSVRLAVGGPIDGFGDFTGALASASPDPLDDPTLGRTMLYTSGTTGRPKGVDRPPVVPGQSRGPNITTAIAGASRQNPETDVHLCTGPLYHAAPLAFSLSGPLHAGVTVVLMDGWDPEETLRLVDRHTVTHTHVVPTMFHRLLALPDDVKQRYDTSSLRFVVHGAAPCPVEVKRGIIEWLGPVVYEYYAATEGGGTFITSEEWLAKPGSVGKPLRDDLVRILDDEGTELGADHVGTVYMHAPAEGRFRYYKDEAKTSGSYRGEYFTLGDHGYLDADGYLYLTGRIAELIISGGVNIYPAEVDAVLLTHPAVADAGTIGVPNHEWGEEVKAVVELKDGYEAGDALGAELIAWCRDRLAHYKCPRTVDFVAELPRHDNGKLYRRKLREMYA